MSIGVHGYTADTTPNEIAAYVANASKQPIEVATKAIDEYLDYPVNSAMRIGLLIAAAKRLGERK